MNDPNICVLPWRSHSSVTDPGAFAALLDEAPADIAGIRRASQELVTHYTGATDRSFVPVTGARLREVDLRYAAAMLGRLTTLGAPTLCRTRPLSERVVGCCRDVAVLFVAMARHKGIPARIRVGYGTYYVRGWYLDHVIAEVWDEGEGRWRLVEPEITDAQLEHAVGGPFDPLDVPADRFVTGPRAWLAARAGDLEPGRFAVAPDLDEPYTRGWSSLRAHVVHDLAALAKVEMVLWDQWGLLDDEDPLARAALLDEVSRLTADPTCAASAVARAFARDGMRLPERVMSYSPAQREPFTVDIRDMLAASLRP